MRIIFLLIGLSLTSSIFTQSLSLDNLTYLFNQRKSQEGITEFVEKKGYDFFKVERTDSPFSDERVHFAYGRVNSQASRWFYIIKNFGKIIAVMYETAYKTDYQNIMTALKAKGFNVISNGTLDDDAIYRVYVKGPVELTCTTTPLYPTGSKYTITVMLNSCDPKAKL